MRKFTKRAAAKENRRLARMAEEEYREQCYKDAVARDEAEKRVRAAQMSALRDKGVRFPEGSDYIRTGVLAW